MEITYYGYNSFLIKTINKKIAIDPGGSLYLFKGWLKTLIPEYEWENITHIFVTHGDPDHYWHVDRVAQKSNAPIICNKTMVKEVNHIRFLLGPRNRGLAFTTEIPKLYTVSPDEEIQVNEVSITGIKTSHGPLVIKFGFFSKKLSPGERERIGWGAIGFEINVDNRIIVNLGDTLLHEKEWKTIKPPDVLMIPIGGLKIHNTMNEKEALQAVKIINPKVVIPCHYNCPGLFTKSANPADDQYFQKEVNNLGYECLILGRGESIQL